MSENKANKADREFPASKLERGKIAANTGLKMGANYARYLARRSLRSNDADADRKALRDRNARDLFTQLTRLRGTALKMAQGLSLHEGLLPEEFTRVMAQAQFQVPPMNPALVRRLIKQNLGANPEDVFAEFDPVAVAAASLGQVHRAKLEDGRIVAVKVQYPNVRESIDSDLKLIRGIAGRFVKPDAVDPYIMEIADRLHEETDYLLEGENIEFFYRIYDNSKIVTPRWIPELTTQRVLTMTFVDGLHLSDYLSTEPPQTERDAFGQILFDFAHKQITGDHLAVHADAHPGNFLFRDDGRIGVLDFGCVKHFPKKFRNDLIDLFAARLNKDRDRVLNLYRDLEFLGDDQTAEQRSFVLDVLDDATGILIEPYREDNYSFSTSDILDGFREMMPRLTGREAFKHRAPIGSHHFVFVNRLVLGFFTILSGLGSTVDVREGRERLLEMAGQPIQ